MRASRPVASLLAAAALVSLASACGGDRAAGEPEPGANEVVMVKSYRFEPETMEIAAGETVTWRNDDNFTHTVQVEDQDDHEVEPGGSVAITFDEAGTFPYVCTLHRHDMEGTVRVK